jgi:P27 family predicted phage terminase small subunit
MSRRAKDPRWRVIEGNSEHRTIDLPPKPPSIRPPCPRIVVDAIGRKRWRYYCKELEEMGILARSDQGIMAAACNAFSRWVRAEERLQMLHAQLCEEYAKLENPPKLPAYSEVITTKSGNFIQNPLVGIANAARDSVVRYEDSLGLSPRARIGLKIDKNASRSLRERMLS